jgi:hypothetical protein
MITRGFFTTKDGWIYSTHYQIDDNLFTELETAHEVTLLR